MDAPSGQLPGGNADSAASETSALTGPIAPTVAIATLVPDRAPEVLAAEALAHGERIARLLRVSFPGLDPGQIENAVEDALVDWVRVGCPPDPRKYLATAAWRNSRDSARSQLVRTNREFEWELDRAALLDDRTIEAEKALQAQQAVQRIHDLLPDERMRAVFRLRARGERRTTAYVAALCLHDLDQAAAKHIVKHEKDRLDKYSRRRSAIRKIAHEWWNGTSGIRRSDALHTHEGAPGCRTSGTVGDIPVETWIMHSVTMT